MARPLKNNASYFGHDAEMRNNRKVKALRARFGLEGYAVWNMLLECLTDADNFCLAWQEIDIELLSGDFGIEAERLREIVEYAQKIGLVCIENEKLLSRKHQERMKPLLEIRDRKRQWKESRKAVSDGENPKSDGENAQSKVKESKVKESKVNNTLSGISLDNTPQKNEIEKIRAASLPEAIAIASAWATTDGAEQIEAFRSAAMYSPEKYEDGSVLHQIAGMFAHYWKTEAQQARIQYDPIGYTTQNLCAWLTNAKRMNKPATNQKADHLAPKYTPPSQPAGVNYQLTREQALYLIHQNAAMFADQFTEKHIEDIRQRSSRPATDLIKIIAKQISQSAPDQFTPAQSAFPAIQATA